MDDRIDLGGSLSTVKTPKVKMRRKRVENLPAVSDIRNQGIHPWAIQRLEIKIEDVIALGFEPRHDMLPRLA